MGNTALDHKVAKANLTDRKDFHLPNIDQDLETCCPHFTLDGVKLCDRSANVTLLNINLSQQKHLSLSEEAVWIKPKTFIDFVMFFFFYSCGPTQTSID